MSKKCGRCGETKDEADFYPDRSHWGWVRAHYRGTPGLALGWGGGKP